MVVVMDIQKLRQEFEKLPDIKGILHGSDFGFNESLNQYYHPDHTNHRLNYAFIMGAWCAFQSQQAQIDELKHQKSLQELAINQISQANQEWQRINSDLQKRVDGALNYAENRKLGNGISGDDSSDLNFIIRTLHGDSEHE